MLARAVHVQRRCGRTVLQPRVQGGRGTRGPFSYAWRLPLPSLFMRSAVVPITMALLTNEQRTIDRATNGAPTSWIGQPKRGIWLRRGDLGVLLVGAFAVAFCLFWIAMATLGVAASPNRDMWWFPLWGVLIMVLALSQTAGPVVLAMMARSHTYYALTNDAFAVIISDFFGFRIKRVYLPAADNIELELKGDGTGTMTFGTPSSGAGWALRGWGAPARPPSFDSIPNAAAVYDMCAKLQRGRPA